MHTRPPRQFRCFQMRSEISPKEARPVMSPYVFGLVPARNCFVWFPSPPHCLCLCPPIWRKIFISRALNSEQIPSCLSHRYLFSITCRNEKTESTASYRKGLASQLTKTRIFKLETLIDTPGISQHIQRPACDKTSLPYSEYSQPQPQSPTPNTTIPLSWLEQAFSLALA